MSYERKVWVNNQTKLNANNMNRIEEGVEEANSVAAQALESADSSSSKVASLTSDVARLTTSVEETNALATLAKSTADSAVEKADAATTIGNEAKASAASAIAKADSTDSKLNSKQDTLISGSSIKTINGESILGKGNIEVAVKVDNPFYEYEEADLNALTEQGVYKIETASNVPADTSVSGTLHVNALGDEHYEQLWYSDSNWARRINSTDSPTPTPTPGITYTLKVNDTEYISSSTSPLTVTLAAVAEYDISGDLYGHIEITSATEPVGPTKLRLKGVNIFSDSDSGIIYSPEKKKLVIEVFANSSNYINVPNGKEKDDAAALLSQSDITITGTGFLALSTNLGHAIKASELVVNGEPKLSIDAVHDAFHASKLLRITGGEFTINSCNDVFSAGSAEDNTKITVEMTITDGKFIINGSTDAIFQNKSTVGNCRIIKGDFEFASDGINEMFQEEDGGTKVNVYDLCTFAGLSEVQQAEVDSRKLILADQYGECKVTYKDGDNQVLEVEGVGDTYSLDKGASIVYTISGNITGKQFITTDKKVDINLAGVYCNEEDESGTILFDYQNTAKRLEVNCTEGYINYIKKNSGIIFHSNSNISLKLKESDATETVPQKIGVGYFSAPNGTVINAYCESTAEPSRSAIAGDGICYVTDSTLGVYANCLWLGNEHADEGEAAWKLGYVSLYLKDNKTDVSLIWKNTTEDKKPGYIYAPWYLLGTAIIGSNLVYADETKKYFEVPAGTVQATYYNTPVVYTTADVSAYAVNSGVIHYDSDFTITEATSFDTTVSEVSVDYGSWVVYKAPDNIYTKEEVDAEVAAAKEAAIAQAKADVDTLSSTLSAEIAKQKVLNDLQEDLLATELYYDYPKITFSVADTLTEFAIKKGNQPDEGESARADIPTFGKNVVVAYNKDGEGYDKGDEIDEKGKASSSAQFNCVVRASEGKQIVAQATPETSYNKCTTVKDATTGLTWVSLTKVVADVSVNLLETTPVTVTLVNNTSLEIQDINGNAIGTEANDLSNLQFVVVHNKGTAKEGGYGYVSSVTIGGVESIDKLECYDYGKKKDKYQLAKEYITGDIIITIAEPVTESSTDETTAA